MAKSNSDVVKAFAAEHGIPCVDVPVAIIDPVNLRGLPCPADMVVIPVLAELSHLLATEPNSLATIKAIDSAKFGIWTRWEREEIEYDQARAEVDAIDTAYYAALDAMD